ncbi:hypothetical protein NKR23_g4855 [Pleurostoma richardsiae]|uniref:CorA-like transporter domain-containing protein n=1 Tax=Pleurostoma richardsiae TaxID=41990 RepID=A0AA38RIE1_9PEZI|nr:hypothetical protein NKR23_g4855 [Pleurostoma richardsiae]
MLIFEPPDTVGGVSFRHFLVPDIDQLRQRIVRGGPEQREHIIPDPKCRFILLNTLHAESRLLCLTKEMLFMLLTYHQVSPCYLPFIACLTSSTGAKGFSAGGSRGPRMNPFGRSGQHYQFAFRLHGMVSLDDRLHKWRQHTAAIYHHFDVQNGSALWILTAPLDQTVNCKRKNFVWEKVKKHIHADSGGGLGAQITDEEGWKRFEASLDIIVAIVEWSLEGCSVYAYELSERIEKVNNIWLGVLLFDSYVSDEGPELFTRHMRPLHNIMDNIQVLSNRLKDNPPVLESMIDFYAKEINRCQGSSLCGDEKCTVRPEVRAAFDSFKARMQAALAETHGIIKQVGYLESFVQNKENLIRQNRDMQRITEATLKDSSAMRQFSVITLILLPITVVSTVLSTDIVKFQGLSSNNSPGSTANSGSTGTSRSPAYSFSPAAFGTWAVAGTLLTFVCLAFSTHAWLPEGNFRAAFHINDRLSLKDSSSVGAEAGDDEETTRKKSAPPSSIRPTEVPEHLFQSQSQSVSPTTLVTSTPPPSSTVERSTAMAQHSTGSEGAVVEQPRMEDNHAAAIGEKLRGRVSRVLQSLHALVTQRRDTAQEHEMVVV